MCPQEEQGPVLIVIEQLVEAFVNNYEPGGNEWDAEEVFTIGKLRSFFCAFEPKPGFIDPIGEYLRILAEYGFSLKVSAEGMPAIFVNRKK